MGMYTEDSPFTSSTLSMSMLERTVKLETGEAAANFAAVLSTKYRVFAY